MKRLFIILIVLLLATGCSAKTTTEDPEVLEKIKNIETNEEVKEEVIQESDREPVESSKEAEEQKVEEAEEQREEEEESQAIITEEAPVFQEPSEIEIAEIEEVEVNNLKIKGLVENELSLTLDELKEMDIIFEGDFYSLNNFGTTGYTYFKGVELWKLLEEKALISPEATKISIVAHDGYAVEFTVEEVERDYIDETNPSKKYPMIIAWEENGQEYSFDDGAPYKLVVGQKEAGDINKPQWVSNIDVIIVE